MKSEDCTEDEIFYKKKCRKISTLMKRHHRGLPESHILEKRLKPSEKKKWDAYWKRIRRESDDNFKRYKYIWKIYLWVQLIVVPVMLMVMVSIADRSWYTRWWWWCIYIFAILLPRLLFLSFPYFSVFFFDRRHRRYWEQAGLSLFHWIILLSPFLLLWSDHLGVRILLNLLIPLDAFLMILRLASG